MASNSYGPRAREDPSCLDAAQDSPERERKRPRRDVHDSRKVFKRRADSGEETTKNTVQRSRCPLYQNVFHAATFGVVHRLCNGHFVLFGENDQHAAKQLGEVNDRVDKSDENVHQIPCKINLTIMRMRRIKLVVKYEQLLSSELEGVKRNARKVH